MSLPHCCNDTHSFLINVPLDFILPVTSFDIEFNGLARFADSMSACMQKAIKERHLTVAVETKAEREWLIIRMIRREFGQEKDLLRVVDAKWVAEFPMRPCSTISCDAAVACENDVMMGLSFCSHCVTKI
jgi:hypothetical protein